SPSSARRASESTRNQDLTRPGGRRESQPARPKDGPPPGVARPCSSPVSASGQCASGSVWGQFDEPSTLPGILRAHFGRDDRSSHENALPRLLERLERLGDAPPPVLELSRDRERGSAGPSTSFEYNGSRSSEGRFTWVRQNAVLERRSLRGWPSPGPSGLG